MKIQTLKDVKEALKDIPDEVLETFGVNFDEEEWMKLMCFADKDPEEEWITQTQKYPQLEDMDKWVTNISKITLDIERSKKDIEPSEEPISSETKLR